MPFEVHELASQSPNGAVTSDRRLFLTADMKAAVEEGDPRARFLLAAPGGYIAAKLVEELGLEVADGKVVVPEVPATKEAEKPEDKQRAPGENKGAKPNKS